MPTKNEDFLHFEICLDRLNSAWKILTAIREHLGHSLAGPAFRFALVEYATSYNRSDGETRKNHRLDERHIPQEMIDVHRRLLTARNTIHAHADLTVLAASVSYVDLQGERLVTRAQNNIHGLEELTNIDEIIRLIEGTLDSMYADRDRRKLALEP